MTCPHPDRQDCPLYHAAHTGDGVGCDDGRLGEQEGCAADRGLPYARLLKELRVRRPDIIAHCEWNADLRRRRGQLQRNLRAAGLH